MKFKIFLGSLPDFACSKIGAFILWALCGYLGGPRKGADNSEPDPYMEEAAEALHRDFQAGGLALVGFVASSPAFMQIWRRSSERRCPKANLEA